MLRPNVRTSLYDPNNQRKKPKRRSSVTIITLICVNDK